MSHKTFLQNHDDGEKNVMGGKMLLNKILWEAFSCKTFAFFWKNLNVSLRNLALACKFFWLFIYFRWKLYICELTQSFLGEVDTKSTGIYHFFFHFILVFKFFAKGPQIWCLPCEGAKNISLQYNIPAHFTRNILQ